ncbi:glycosyltransferase family 25 protein [Devosia rhizoryzae]|uniref:Glycosyltransferase family 25 protein n=1 Tax=Devosia rhizoryzae TaxID=2774137 RepID=A0ABX7C5E0_9HYPH|nr:glycosyltransferase family 25 protein [Devosia rhizoryzae]QQR39428.1 glycosyltransferase family 25 protein [Devosia rhizoryzae]
MQVYYINLADRPDRRRAMEDRFDALGIVATRVEAATPNDVDENMRALYCNTEAYRWQTPPEVACSLSHLRALKLFLNSREDYALILEDDAILSSRLPAFLKLYVASKPEIDLTHLETDHARLRLAPKAHLTIGGVGIFRAYNTLRGAAGYIVSRKAAARILAGTEVLELMTDQALFNPFERPSCELVVRQTDPALIIQEEFVDDHATSSSDLGQFRVQRVKEDASNVKGRLWYNAVDLFRRDVWQPIIKAWHEYAGGAKRRAVRFER